MMPPVWVPDPGSHRRQLLNCAAAYHFDIEIDFQRAAAAVPIERRAHIGTWIERFSAGRACSSFPANAINVSEDPAMRPAAIR